MSKFSKVILKIMVISHIILLPICLFAKDYTVKEGKSINIPLSTKGVNRISIAHDRIAQVIGNEDEYIIDSDKDLGIIFITPRGKDGDKVAFSLLTELEKVIDVNGTVSSIEPQVINLKYEEGQAASKSDANSFTFNYQAVNGGKTNRKTKQEVIDILKAVEVSQPVSSHSSSCKINKQLKVINGGEYQVKNTRVLKAVFQNKGEEEIVVDEVLLSKCVQSFAAVAIDKDVIKVQDHATIYWVMQND